MKFRKRPVTIEAVQIRWSTWDDVCLFLGDVVSEVFPAIPIHANEASDTCGEEGPMFISLRIPTLEGVMIARHGDWIIRGVQGELYPCRPDIFAATYEPAE